MSQDFTIAIVEDHESLREMMVNHFKKENFKVFGGAMAEELDEYFKKNIAHLLILDVNLPGEDGLSVAKGKFNTKLTLTENNDGKYEAFYFFHNDIMHTIVYEQASIAGFAQYVVLEISAA